MNAKFKKSQINKPKTTKQTYETENGGKLYWLGAVENTILFCLQFTGCSQLIILYCNDANLVNHVYIMIVLPGEFYDKKIRKELSV